MFTEDVGAWETSWNSWDKNSCLQQSLYYIQGRQTTGKKYLRTSLGIQWLRVHFPMWWTWVWFLVGELRSHMLQAHTLCNPCATTRLLPPPLSHTLHRSFSKHFQIPGSVVPPSTISFAQNTHLFALLSSTAKHPVLEDPARSIFRNC